MDTLPTPYSATSSQVPELSNLQCLIVLFSVPSLLFTYMGGFGSDHNLFLHPQLSQHSLPYRNPNSMNERTNEWMDDSHSPFCPSS